MPAPPDTSPLDGLIGRVVVLDLRSRFVCLGTLAAAHDAFLELRDADLHDLRDSTATRETYVFDSRRLGIRRNRRRVLVAREEVVGIAAFDDVVSD